MSTIRALNYVLLAVAGLFVGACMREDKVGTTTRDRAAADETSTAVGGVPDTSSFRQVKGKAPSRSISQGVDAILAAADGISLGANDAPVAVYEFADYQCPACRTAALRFLPAFKNAYVETGRVRLIHLDLPLSIHPNAEIAALAARCAAEMGRYERYAEMLYARQSAWSGLVDPRGVLVDYAKEVGFDRARFEGCLSSGRHIAAIRSNAELARSLGVQGTPTFFVAGERIMGSGREIVAAVESALANR